MGRIKESAQREVDARLGAATLGELAADGLGVFCWCNRCGHNAVLEIGRLLGELGAAFPVPEVGGRLRCTGCGGKDIATRPAWPGLGPVTSHAPDPEPGESPAPNAERPAADTQPDTLAPADQTTARGDPPGRRRG
ncbi:hypothetical protein [Rhodovibrio sodomensis]|uniref:hypothetical protein n=1 Tax=Rhodovibrio sodomensis TaxID=1088 RepID=UPI0019052391|nr:hypothetical protein [Rhodovibrio sodomensis]